MAAKRKSEKGALELLEEAVHLLRLAPLQVLLCYYIGALPFVFGFLFFWADMSRSAFAAQHVGQAALGLVILFIWMKIWQTIFADGLTAQISGKIPAPWTFRLILRVVSAQIIFQPSGFFILPLSLLIVVPFGWVFAFYQNLTILAANQKNPLFKTAAQQAGFFPNQNHVGLLILGAFAFFLWLNMAVLIFMAPGLIKTFLGIETVFSRAGGFALFNTTFFAASFALTYLCVDPLVKSFYALRCFYGQAVATGEDLKVELRARAQLSRNNDDKERWKPQIDTDRHRCQGGQALARISPNDGLNRFSLPGLLSAFIWVHRWFPFFSAARFRLRQVGVVAVLLFSIFLWNKILFAADSPPPPPTVDASKLDRSIERVLQQPEFTWRLPREKPEITAKKNWFILFLESVMETLARAARTVRDWIRDALEWLAKFFRQKKSHDDKSSSGSGWMVALQWTVFVLIALIASALALLVFRMWKRRAKSKVVLAQPVIATLDLNDENLAANQLPEDGWLKLARELMDRGELRLALRALYLAGLAHLAAREFVRLASFKSNREYEQELRRRARALPELQNAFGQNVTTFDRAWYGMHEVTLEILRGFQSNLERIRAC